MNKRDTLSDGITPDKFDAIDTSHALEREALLASQMRMLDLLQADMAHQLRGPLNALTLTAALLENTVNANRTDAELHTKQLRYLGIFREELSRLNSLIDLTTHELSAVLWQEPEALSLQQLVQTCLQQFSPVLTKKRLTYKFDEGHNPYTAQLRAGAFRVVFFNLCSDVLCDAKPGEMLIFTLHEKPDVPKNQSCLLDVSIQAIDSQNPVSFFAQPLGDEKNSCLEKNFSAQPNVWLAQQLLQDASGTLKQLFHPPTDEQNSRKFVGYRYEFTLSEQAS